MIGPQRCVLPHPLQGRDRNRARGVWKEPRGRPSCPTKVFWYRMAQGRRQNRPVGCQFRSPDPSFPDALRISRSCYDATWCFRGALPPRSLTRSLVPSALEKVSVALATPRAQDTLACRHAAGAARRGLARKTRRWLASSQIRHLIRGYLGHQRARVCVPASLPGF